MPRTKKSKPRDKKKGAELKGRPLLSPLWTRTLEQAVPAQERLRGNALWHVLNRLMNGAPGEQPQADQIAAYLRDLAPGAQHPVACAADLIRAAVHTLPNGLRLSLLASLRDVYCVICGAENGLRAGKAEPHYCAPSEALDDSYTIDDFADGDVFEFADGFADGVSDVFETFDETGEQMVITLPQYPSKP